MGTFDVIIIAFFEKKAIPILVNLRKNLVVFLDLGDFSEGEQPGWGLEGFFEGQGACVLAVTVKACKQDAPLENGRFGYRFAGDNGIIGADEVGERFS